MNCTEFLPALETGGFWRRRAARQHARHCRACAEVLVHWRALKAELNNVPALSDRERGLWLGVPRPASMAVRWDASRASLALALAATILLFLCWWSLRNGSPVPRDEGPSLNPRLQIALITAQGIAREVAPLEQGLQRLERELAILSQRAALVDVKRQTEKLLEQYRHW